MGRQFEICGIFDDQQGIVEKGRIVGYNSHGMPVRRYKWIKPKLRHLEGESFEAFDDQIEFARERCEHIKEEKNTSAWRGGDEKCNAKARKYLIELRKSV